VVQVGTRYPRPVPYPDRQATRIGDVVAPRQVSHAIAEGRAAGLDIRAGARTAARIGRPDGKG
jgi:2,4-dienoyl-CoA reductase (NADPH2)